MKKTKRRKNKTNYKYIGSRTDKQLIKFNEAFISAVKKRIKKVKEDEHRCPKGIRYIIHPSRLKEKPNE